MQAELGGQSRRLGGPGGGALLGRLPRRFVLHLEGDHGQVEAGGRRRGAHGYGTRQDAGRGQGDDDGQMAAQVAQSISRFASGRGAGHGDGKRPAAELF
ncbi:MAG: hypothetical protein IPH48_10740 [bacterium]|nr:hypothetical protein [bacterium]